MSASPVVYGCFKEYLIRAIVPNDAVTDADRPGIVVASTAVYSASYLIVDALRLLTPGSPWESQMGSYRRGMTVKPLESTGKVMYFLSEEVAVFNGDKKAPKHWYPNGRLRFQGAWDTSTGNRTGEWLSWHENGALCTQGKWDPVSGNKTGLWRKWDENEQLVSEGKFDPDTGKKTGE